VHVDGIITLGTPTILDLPQIRRKFVFPPDVRVIAPFYAPASISNTSRVTYYESRDAGILSRATRDVQASFRKEQDFNATAVFVATWYQVKHAHHRQARKNNTFQAVLITDGAKTFVMFNYATRGLQWTKGYHVYWEGQRQTHAQSGFSAGDFVRYYKLPGSGEDDVHFLSSKSNMMSSGQWIFNVGWPVMHGMEVQPADSYETKATTALDFIAEQCKSDKTSLFVFKGCFVVHGYLTTNRSQIWRDVNIRTCMVLCHQQRQRYAALHAGSQCACMSDLQHLIEASTDKCNMTCTVADNEFCGGRNTASIYKVVAHAAVQSDQSSGVVQQKGAVQRMVGFLTGSLNGQTLNNLDMDTIAFSVDGRAYVSVRSFPSSLGNSARILTPLTDATGWLYAKPKPSGFRNGFDVVGAKFVRRAAVRFDSGEEVGIYQNYKGFNSRTNYISVETEIRGTIPPIEAEAIVRMNKFRQEFKRTGPGRMQSRGTVKYEVDGAEHSFTVDQFIDYNEQKGCGNHVDKGVLETDVISLRHDKANAFLVIAVKATFINATLDTLDGRTSKVKSPQSLVGLKRSRVTSSESASTFEAKKSGRCNHGYLGARN
ncbi:hypothetical protein QZH41_011391, partial [Actinostola sp. cb2023]